MQKTITTALLCCTFAACGGNDDSSSNNPGPERNTVAIEDYANLRKTDIEASVLKYATEEELLNHIQNGLRLNVWIHDRLLPIGSPVPEIASDFDGLSAAVDGGFSETNTHVTGVDEADYVKYDGQYLFISTRNQSDDGSQPPPTIRIMETTPESAEIREISTISMSNEVWGNVDELYLLGDENGSSHLVTLRSDWGFSTAIDSFAPYETDREIQITSYDVSDPTSPEEQTTIAIDGYIQNSRKIGNILYLVTSFTPYFDDIQYYFSEDDEDGLEANEARIAALDLSDLLPSIRINDGAAQALLRAEDCLIPANSDDNWGYATITTVIAIDLEAQAVVSANCLNAQVGGIYANQNSLYIGGSAYRSWGDYQSYTVIHKFNLGDAISYRSTGIVPGWLGWQDPSFRMDAYEGNLRIITTEGGWSDPTHRLSVLQDDPNSDAMQVIAELPNDTHRAAIGKPGEDIYAVRFVGDRGYIVTFQRTDPLYVLDLSIANAPIIAGELEVPGFSSYLHPVGENYLLGIGQDADDTGQTSGVQVSLFDIRDISAPDLIAKETYGEQGSWTSALYDLRAISFLAPTSDQLRFVFPISSYADGWDWQDDALHLFEINGLDSSTAALSFVGKIVSEEKSEAKPWPSYSGLDRGVLHDEAVYYSHGNGVWASFWSSPNAATGPH